MAVTVGISYTEYYLNSSGQPMTAYTATSGTLYVVCGRLSFTLGLKAWPTPREWLTHRLSQHSLWRMASISCPTTWRKPPSAACLEAGISTHASSHPVPDADFASAGSVSPTAGVLLTMLAVDTPCRAPA